MPRAVKTKTPKKEHPIKDLLSIFDQAHQRRFGKPYRVVGGRDSACAKSLLIVYSLDDLRRWIEMFFSSPDQFIRSGSYTFAFFSSQVGKFIAQEAGGVTLKPKTVRALQGIYGD